MVTREKQQDRVTKTQEKAVVQWKGEQITVSFRDVKTLICPLASDQETAVFLKTCQSLSLNPFAGEIYLIKYSDDDKAATVISIDSYLKAAEVNENYSGCEAGIILRDSGGKLEFREGAFLLEDEKSKLAGGWARVYRKDRDRPTYIAVNKTECIRLTRHGKPTRFWTEEKQPSMLRKVALKRALVEAFPSLFAGTLATAEVAPDTEEGYEVPEGEIPPAMEKEGKPDWRKFWARVKSELGLTTEQARELLHVESVKKDLIDQGVSMERIWDSLVNALQGQKEAARAEQVVDAETGEVNSRNEDLFGEEDAGAAVPAKPKRDPETIKTINDLLKACNQDFHLQPKDVYKELGYKSQSDIHESPAECYIAIAAQRD
jgi:phage recombination protein Bet